MSTEEAMSTLINALGAEFAGPVAPPESEVIEKCIEHLGELDDEAECGRELTR